MTENRMVPATRKKNSVHLAWDSKPRRAASPKDIEFQTAEIVIPNPATANQSLVTYSSLATGTIEKTKTNRLIWGDNLLTMQALLASGYENKIRLIYIDPPFWTSEDYYAELTLEGEDFRKSPSILERLAYKDYWANGVDSYLDMLYPRLQLMKRLLAEDGSIYVHLDWHVDHYVRMLLDEIFGRDNFHAEIIWQRTSSHTNAFKNYGIINDTILFYTKSQDYLWNPQYTDYTEDQIEGRFKHLDKDGRKYELHSMLNPASAIERPNLNYEWHGIRRTWLWSREKMDEMLKAGKIEFSSTGYPYLKYYLDEMKGMILQNVWIDIPNVRGNAKTGYPTQKPVKLLKRIIEASSNEGDIVFDGFIGSGTTAIAAQELNRRWIGCDFSKTAIQIARNRLVTSSNGSFLLENIGNYQRHLIYLQQARIYEMQAIVLKLYGANIREDFPDMGTKRSSDGKEELVFVSYPDRAVTASKVAELAVMAEELDGKGFDKLVVLGWDYEYNYDEILEERKKNSKKKWVRQVESKNIPPEIYEYLRQAKDLSDVDSLDGKIRFHDKPLLRLLKPSVKEDREGHMIELGIDKYILFDYPVDSKQLPELRELVQKQPFAIIDYWAVDWNYDGSIFRSTWQALRQRGKDIETVPFKTKQFVEGKGSRQVAVRVVDVFGNDAGSSLTIKL